MKHIGAPGDLDKMALDITTEIVVARLQNVTNSTVDKEEGEEIGEMFTEIFKAVSSVIESKKSN